MKTRMLEQGEIGWIVLWLIGVPIPLLLVLYSFAGARKPQHLCGSFI